MNKEKSPVAHERRAVAIATFAYVGCFTTKERKGRGKGISVYRIDSETGEWTLAQIQETLPNPGFLVLDGTQKYLYSAHGIATMGIYTDDAADTEVSAYSIDHVTGKLKLLNRQSTRGDNSRVAAIHPGNRYVVVGSGPGVASLEVTEDGSLAACHDRVVPSAEPGTFREEEKGPHPHDTVFDPTGRFVLAPDKGLDRVHVYGFDATNGKFIENVPPYVQGRYGAACRHAVFHPSRPFVYVVNEDATVAAYKWNPERGELNLFQLIPTAPPTFIGANKASEIAVAPSGNFVYVSNRGHDSIGIFAIDRADGTLRPIGWEPSQGKTPRFFTFDSNGTLLYVANEDSDSIVVFKVDTETGKVAATGQVVKTESPSCIVFAHQNSG